MKRPRIGTHRPDGKKCGATVKIRYDADERAVFWVQLNNKAWAKCFYCQHCWRWLSEESVVTVLEVAA